MKIKSSLSAIPYLKEVEFNIESTSFREVLNGLALSPATTGVSIYIISLEDWKLPKDKQLFLQVMQRKHPDNNAILVFPESSSIKEDVPYLWYAKGKDGVNLTRTIENLMQRSVDTVAPTIPANLTPIDTETDKQAQEYVDLVDVISESNDNDIVQNNTVEEGQAVAVNIKEPIPGAMTAAGSMETGYEIINKALSHPQNLVSLNKLLQDLKDRRNYSAFLKDHTTIEELNLEMSIRRAEIDKIMRNSSMPIEDRLRKVKAIVAERVELAALKQTEIISQFADIICLVVEKACGAIDERVNEISDQLSKNQQVYDHTTNYGLYFDKSKEYADLRLKIVELIKEVGKIATNINDLASQREDEAIRDITLPTNNAVINKQLESNVVPAEVRKLVLDLSALVLSNIDKLSGKEELIKEVQETLKAAYAVDTHALEQSKLLVHYLSNNPIEDSVVATNIFKTRLHTFLGKQESGITLIGTQFAEREAEKTAHPVLLINLLEGNNPLQYAPNAKEITPIAFLEEPASLVDSLQLVNLDPSKTSMEDILDALEMKIRDYQAVVVLTDEELLELPILVGASFTTNYIVDSRKLEVLESLQENLDRVRQANTAFKIIFNYCDNVQDVMPITDVSFDIGEKLVAFPFFRNLPVAIKAKLVPYDIKLIKLSVDCI